VLGLVLIASHMVGDFIFSNRWQAAAKLTDRRVRSRHVLGYVLAFVPAVIIFWPGTVRALAFLLLLDLLHFATDSRRFTSTLGDWVGWWFRTDAQKHLEWSGQPTYGKVGSTSDSMPPNPWSPIVLLIDQSLHLVQLAALGWLLT
jgi:hypothetical protein